MRNSTVGILLAVGVVARSVIAAPASAKIRDCNIYAYYPNVKISSATNMSCTSAARDMKRYKGGLQIVPNSGQFQVPSSKRQHLRRAMALREGFEGVSI